MRITRQQIARAKALVQRYFGAEAQLRLFGSRVDDTKRGGDYDFFIETTLTDPDQIVARRLELIAALQATQEFEDERVDVVVKRRTVALELPVYASALKEGIPL